MRKRSRSPKLTIELPIVKNACVFESRFLVHALYAFLGPIGLAALHDVPALQGLAALAAAQGTQAVAAEAAALAAGMAAVQKNCGIAELHTRGAVIDTI